MDKPTDTSLSVLKGFDERLTGQKTPRVTPSLLIYGERTSEKVTSFISVRQTTDETDSVSSTLITKVVVCS